MHGIWDVERVLCKRAVGTFVLLRVRLNLEVLLVFDTVWGCSYTLMCYICMLSKYTKMAITTLRWSTFVGWMYWLNGYCIGPGRADCTFALLRVRLNLKVLMVFNAVLFNAILCGNLTLLICWRWQICVDLRLLNVWNGCRVDPKQTVCKFIP